VLIADRKILGTPIKLWGLYGFRRPSLKDRLVNKLLNWRAGLRYRQRLTRQPTV
jgi:hypothetical protein